MNKTFALLGVCIISAVCAQIALKLGLNRFGAVERITLGVVLAMLRGPWVLAGIGFYLISALSWMLVLSRVELSFAYPLLMLTGVGVAWASTLFLGESMTLSRLVGTLLTLGGAWLVVRS